MTIDLTTHTETDAEPVADPQSFAPAPVRVERSRIHHGRSHRAPLISLENVRQHARNRYEGVLIAAARARQLNAKKVALEERGMEEALELKRMKMTSHALQELMGGKIEVQRREEGL
ncbi:MAG: DNA-directed RNA polymerase subunit omega [Candidatus Zixiibacteriota bacterium]